MMPILLDDPRHSALDARRSELLTVKEFAYLLRLHEMTVYRRIREGRQSGVVRFGREIRIDLARACQSLAEYPAAL